MTVMLLAASAISMTTTENAFSRKYGINQATSTSNSCLNPLFDSSTLEIVSNIGNCGNTVSQQAEEGQASSPITLQTSSPTIEVQALPPEPPEPQTCEECFTNFLADRQIAEFTSIFTGGQGLTIFEVCALLEQVPPEQLPDTIDTIAGLLQLVPGIPTSTIDEIIDCLERVLGVPGSA